MAKVNLLDCTLRDGGYINEWNFGIKAIKGIMRKLENTGIEMIEVGFLKGRDYNPSKTLFPDTDSIKAILENKQDNVTYVAMLDMSAPIDIKKIMPNDGTSVDGIRVIFKKNKIKEAYDTCKQVKALGYKVFVNFVSTDAYSDKEFIEGIELFNTLNPDGVTIVDTFGSIRRRQFRRLVAIADNNLNEGIMLCYHAHNNLQQAFGNAEIMVEMNLKRDIVIDACVFGMGRGAGNLNLELFAEYMNDNFNTAYRIQPMLEIMDEYLTPFYKTKFWGYSLPLYLSAINGCHPNYAIHLAEKNTLSEKALNELLENISDEDKYVFSKEKAESYYAEYMSGAVDDVEAIEELKSIFYGKRVLLLAPGKTLQNHAADIKGRINENTIVLSVNFYDEMFPITFVFVGNNRRYNQIVGEGARIIATSNILDSDEAEYVINVRNLVGEDKEIVDNSALMALKLLLKLGVTNVEIAGMDGGNTQRSYYKEGFEAYRAESIIRDEVVAEKIKSLREKIAVKFITPTNYE